MSDEVAQIDQPVNGDSNSLIGEIIGVGLFWGCFGLGLLWKWWVMPTGSNLITHLVKQTATSLLCVTAAIFIGKYIGLCLKRLKSKK
ncbi:MAG: hypothetical protein WB424_00320 [Terracidiphilus sp.]